MIVVDWDGTATTEDTLIKAMEEFGDWQVYLDASAALSRGEITLHEEIRRDAEGIKAPLEEVQAWLVEHMQLRRALCALAPEVVVVGARDGPHPPVGLEPSVRTRRSRRPCHPRAITGGHER